MTRLLAVMLLLLLLLPGCSSRKRDSEVDKLWRQGYGFNNPNRDRVRSGKRPLEFNESQKKKRDD